MNTKKIGTIKCCICQSETVHVSSKTALSDLFECLNCAHVFYAFRPDKKVLDDLYADEKYYDEGPGIEKKAEYLWERRFYSISKYIRYFNGNILDVGCGKAVFLDQAKKQGMSVFGTEYSEYTSKYAIEKYGINPILKDLLSAEFKNNFFDVVSFWHVLEHLYYPSKYIQEACRIMKKGGILIVELPNKDVRGVDIDNQIKQNQTHLNFFTEKSIKTLLYSNGFRILSCSYKDPRDYAVKISSKIHHFIEEKTISAINVLIGRNVGSTIRVIAAKK
ncbi:MAG: class I SAM-dependent methyltransferase [Candidatus Firestonebacteria bacterium]